MTSRRSVQSAPLDEALLQAALGELALPGEELREFADEIVSRRASVLRCRRGVSPDEFGFALEQVPWYELGYRSTDRSVRPSHSLHFAAGDYYLQDAGSLLALAACDADQSTAWWVPTDRPPLVCDLCAAPGGKATALVEMLTEAGALGDQGFLIANEPIRSRLPALTYNLARTGSDRYAITSMDPQRLAEQLSGSFDLVFVDAPCSGQSLLSRDRQTLAALSTRQIEHAAARQRRILESAVQLLRPGGALVYSTCTFAEAENEAQVRWLVEAHSMEPFSVPRLDPYASPLASGSYRLWPHRHDTAGSFAAALRRSIETQNTAAEVTETSGIPHVVPRSASSAGPPGERRRRRARGDNKSSRQRVETTPIARAELDPWVSGLDDVRIQTRGASVIGWPIDAPDWVESIATSGPELAHRTGKTWKPAHAAALRRVSRGTPSHRLVVDEKTAQQFLAGQPIACTKRGWFVVCWQQRPLGWAKGNGTQAKNHLPSAARQT